MILSLSKCKCKGVSVSPLISAIHFLISHLKLPRDTDCLISCGTNLNVFDPKCDRVSVPF